ncbi:MAG: phenylacetate--CoA ligase [Desulfobacteraceae bacterium]|nr:phenylacetate--CoA ligase [Desulfobacteraceae bacterium]
MNTTSEFWDKSAEDLSREDLEALQLSRLQSTLERVMRSPFYSRRFAETGFRPDAVTHMSDARSIPFTTKQDLRDSFPYGLLCEPRDRLARMHASSGTTGQSVAIFYTKTDLQTWADLVARCMYMTGARPGDTFQNLSGYGLFTGGLGFQYGAERLGMLTIPAGAGNSKRQIQLMRDFSTNVIHIIPSFALLLMDVFKEQGVDPREDLSLKIAFIGAEPYSEEVRKRLEDFYGIKVYNSYGLSEMNGPGVGFECPQQNGMHIWEDSYMVEIVDPKTLEPVPDGQYGELVMTTLRREAMPIVRYRTKDLTRILPGPCPCGRVHRRIDRIQGRSDDMFIIKGVNVFPIQVEQVLMNIPEVGNNYVIVLRRENNIDDMIVRVEVTDRIFVEDMRLLHRLQQRIARDLKSELLLTPKVELAEPNSLPKSEGKAVRLLDQRKL